MTPARRLGVLLAGVAVAVAVAGCTSSANDSSGADDPVISTVPAPAPPTSAPVPSTSAAGAPTTPIGSTASSPSTSAAPSTAPTPTPAPRSTCTKVGIRVIPGGASMGQEIAALQFTNEGTSTCTLVGYPSVTLLLKGSSIGRPSAPSSQEISSRTLAPGDVAESLLHDFVQNCQAPISDNVRVVVPGSTISGVRPTQLRACTVRVDKLGLPD